MARAADMAAMAANAPFFEISDPHGCTVGGMRFCNNRDAAALAEQLRAAFPALSPMTIVSVSEVVRHDVRSLRSGL